MSEVAVSADAIPPLSATDARAITDQIKVAVEATWVLVKRAYVERAWAALGYDGWDDYCTREFGTSRLRLPREERSEVVASLRESGLSVRAIASATGISKDTVSRSLAGVSNETPAITGTDGKTYAPTQPAREATPQETTFTCWSCQDDHPTASHVESDDGPMCEPCFEVYERIDVVTNNAPTPVTDADLTPGPVAPIEPTAPRRRPITEAFDSATFNLKRAIESVARLAADDRMEKNKDQIKASNLSDLVRVRDAINGVINTIEG